MRVLFASSEVYPFSKTGGLADVAGALPRALARLGHEVLVVTPWYEGLRGGSPLWIGDVQVPFDGGSVAVGVGTLERDGVRFAFIGHPDFQRPRLYGYPDDVHRFCRFTRAVPQVAERVGFAPDLVHAHDWHTGYLPVVLARGWHLPPGFPGIPTVLTLHNVQYQGHSELGETLRWLRLPAELAGPPVGESGRANALRAGCAFATRITTVSPSYAEEILSPRYGYSLETTLAQVKDRLEGILNGIETEDWDPATDPHLPAPYDLSDISGKAKAKRELCRRAGLTEQRPLLGVVSRLAEQKGMDLLAEAGEGLTRQGWSLFVLGTGDPELELALSALAADNPDVAVELEYDEGLAHLVYAGSDALAIPSRFEPCGLSQLIAMRYGTLPIARATGGLRDTIEAGLTGFLFAELDRRSLLAAAHDALCRWRTREWREMVRAAMAQDFSWQRSARRYEELYAEMVVRS